jgi:hypothetical protein
MKPLAATELQRYIGQGGKYKANGFNFFVTVADARSNYNILELLVRPVAGEGECWVSASFVTLEEQMEVPWPTQKKGTGIFGEGKG